jgi:hypothetical protein
MTHIKSASVGGIVYSSTLIGAGNGQTYMSNSIDGADASTATATAVSVHHIDLDLGLSFRGPLIFPFLPISS